MRDWVVAQDMERDYWHAVLNKIGERLKPEGIDLQTMLREAELELSEKSQDIGAHNPFRFYIEVDNYTSESDVRSALGMLRAQQGGQPPRRTRRRDPLVAVQAAILYDRHNPRDPQDGRRWLRTYPRLARELGLPIKKKRIQYAGGYVDKQISASAQEYVKLGRAILKKSSTE